MPVALFEDKEMEMVESEGERKVIKHYLKSWKFSKEKSPQAEMDIDVHSPLFR